MRRKIKQIGLTLGLTLGLTTIFLGTHGQTKQTVLRAEVPKMANARERQNTQQIKTDQMRFIHGTYLDNNFILTTDGSLWILEDFDGLVGEEILIAYDTNGTQSKLDDIIIDYHRGSFITQQLRR